ncbi:MAG: opacity protein [Flavobacterium sp. BFFFF2]|nr:MAG: opacity protein [Flavobacterium sp. BFFFF2]
MRRAILLGFFVLSTLANAQGFHMGIKGGLNVSQLSKQTDQTVSSAYGFHAGVLAEIKVLGKASFQPELLFSAQGSKAETQNLGATTTYTDKLYYLQLPLMAKVFVFKGLFVEAGPQFGLLLSANRVTDVANAASSSNDIKGNLKSFDYAANVGVGYDLFSHLMANVRYSFGLNDINDTPNGDAVKNGVFQLSLAVKF